MYHCIVEFMYFLTNKVIMYIKSVLLLLSTFAHVETDVYFHLK